MQLFPDLPEDTRTCLIQTARNKPILIMFYHSNFTTDNYKLAIHQHVHLWWFDLLKKDDDPYHHAISVNWYGQV